jgi:hypothetical protein
MLTRNVLTRSFSSRTSYRASTHIGDGRSFAFHIQRNQLVVEVYRPRLAGPVPQPEDVVAVATRGLTDIDVTDERSLVAAVRDAVANAEAVSRAGSKPPL